MSINLEGGFFLVDKPLEWTSFQVVNKIKYLFKHRAKTKLKIGHAGTLDPLATGLLIVCYGKMTKQITSFQDLRKGYSGVFKIGATTPSFDLETEIDKTYPTEHITDNDLKKAALKLTGEQLQSPPIYSAKKVDGVRGYKAARKGIPIEMRKSQIEVFKFNVELIKENEVKFYIECSKGTYIRSLANDFGQLLGSGAFLKQLRRESIGEYNVQDAKSLSEIEEEFTNAEFLMNK